jgi:hypothetical protein
MTFPFSKAFISTTFTMVPSVDYVTDSYKKIQQDATVYQNLLFRLYLKLNMFRATHRPSSGA